MSIKQKILTVNDIITKEFDINNYINLFPTLKESVPWSIDLDEYFTINSYITKYADETTDYLIDLNLLDIPAYDLIDLSKYNDSLESNGISYESSRGCPYACTFCYVYIFHDRTFRGKSPEKVLEEVKYLKEVYDIKKLSFVEDYMWSTKNRALDQFKLFIEHDINVKWSGFCRADFLSRIKDEEMDIIADSGAEILSLGLETGSERMLKHIKKHITVDQAKTAVKRCADRGIMTECSFIIGMPTETEADVEESIKMYDILTNFSDNVEINGFFLYTPYPGVPLYDEALELGYTKNETLEEWVPESDGVVFEGAEYWCRDCDGCTEPEIVGNEEVENNDE